MRYPLGPRVRVNVTKEAITKAISADSSKCWIAESIKAAVPKATNVVVDLSTTRFSDLEKGLRYVYLTPYSAQLALIAFDEGNPPPPFSFILKNAHVSKAGTLPVAKELRDKVKTAREKKKLERQSARRATLTKQKLVARSEGKGSVPRRVGGKRPPQLRMKRQFGIRAFRGASRQRLEADAALADRADNMSLMS